MKILVIKNNSFLNKADSKASDLLHPEVVIKPDSAILKNNKPFFIPEFTKELQCEAELIVKINRLGKNIATRFASRYYAEIGLGIDFTALDLQRHLFTANKPLDLANSFDNSAAIGDFVPVAELNNLSFCFTINGDNKQAGDSLNMTFCIDELISYVSSFVTLKIGDILFTGAPLWKGTVNIGDRLEGFICGKKMIDIQIK